MKIRPIDKAFLTHFYREGSSLAELVSKFKVPKKIGSLSCVGGDKEILSRWHLHENLCNLISANKQESPVVSELFVKLTTQETKGKKYS